MKKLMLVFLAVGLLVGLVAGCGAAEEKNDGQKKKEKPEYHEFKAEILEYQASGKDARPTITVVIDHVIYTYDCLYDNNDYGGDPIKVENNNIKNIEGSYLYGKVNSDGYLQNAIIKEK
jgi:ABC-type oligopeptide transport system substrate-binding subunit